MAEESIAIVWGFEQEASLHIIASVRGPGEDGGNGDMYIMVYVVFEERREGDEECGGEHNEGQFIGDLLA